MLPNRANTSSNYNCISINYTGDNNSFLMIMLRRQKRLTTNKRLLIIFISKALYNALIVLLSFPLYISIRPLNAIYKYFLILQPADTCRTTSDVTRFQEVQSSNCVRIVVKLETLAIDVTPHNRYLCPNATFT